MSALIALKIILLFVLAWNSRFVMDEFVQLGWAKYLGNGLFETVWPAKAVGYAVFYKLAHVIGWDAQSILLVGRLQTALLACGTTGIVYLCARALGEDRVRALAIVLVLLAFSNFMERIFRTIAEPLALFFAAAALLVVLRGQADKARPVMAAGILGGLAFLATQKSVYFNVALGLALVGDVALAGRWFAGIVRGARLVLGWLIPIAGYCLLFGGTDPLAVAANLLSGPLEVATTGADAYRGLRHYVAQTLSRNAILYGFCFAGMALELLRIGRLGERRRIALIFSVVVTVLVFTHDQPWPYVFVMALPFLALWSLTMFDELAARPRVRRVAWAVLGIAIAASFVKNALYLRHDNADQLALVARAEALIAPGEEYFDGVGMLPNRPEPTTLWLDRSRVLDTLREGQASEAYRVLAGSPPKMILWSYRMDSIDPVVAPLVRDSYVAVAPNIRMAGRRLQLGKAVRFKVPVAGPYQLYGEDGEPVAGQLETEGQAMADPFELSAGTTTITLRNGPAEALLLPQGSYGGLLEPGRGDAALFANVYD